MDIGNLIKAGISHSCFPNCGYNLNNELVLIDEIKPGERLTVDFSTLFTGYQQLFKCTCGCNGCRINILGFDQIPVYFQEKYLKLGVVSKETLKEFENQACRSIHRERNTS